MCHFSALQPRQDHRFGHSLRYLALTFWRDPDQGLTEYRPGREGVGPREQKDHRNGRQLREEKQRQW